MFCPRELFQQNLDSDVEANLALSYETVGNYEKAKDQYKSLIQGNHDVTFWKEGYIKCLESLCEWDTLSLFTDTELGTNPVKAVANDPWMDSVMLPNFLKSKLYLIGEVRSDHNSTMKRLFETIDGLRKLGSASKKSFEKRFGLQLALLYMYKMKKNDGKVWQKKRYLLISVSMNVSFFQFWINRCLNDLLIDWTTKDEFSSIGISESLTSLRRIVQLEKFMTFPNELSSSIKPGRIDPKDTLQMWTGIK